MLTYGGPGNHVLDVGPGTPQKGALLGVMLNLSTVSILYLIR